MNMLRLALIGCGSHSENAHASALAHYVAQHPGDVDLAAACDMDIGRALRFCQEYGFAGAYSDVEEMLETEKPDAVVSILPIEKIAEIGSLLLRRHIPCVLEKPPGQSLEEASALAEVARQTGTPHMVSLNRRFSPYLHRAMAWAREIGPLRYLRGQMFRRGRSEEDFLWGTGVHVVDAMCHIGGEIAASDTQCLEHPSGSAPWFLISLRFVSGCAGHIEILPTVGRVEERYELFGDDFQACAITMGGGGESVRCWKQGALEVEESANTGDPLFLRDGSYEETSAFIRALLEGAPLRPSLEDVLPTLRVCGQMVGKGL
jgi:predicted dehydrogenase